MGRSLILEIPFSGQQVPFRQNSSALGHLGRRKIACAACSTAVSIHCQGNNPLKAGTHQPWATVGTVEWHALLAAPRSQSSKESKITSHHVTGIQLFICLALLKFSSRASCALVAGPC